MQKAIAFVTILELVSAVSSETRGAQTTCEYAVEASAFVQASPPQITLTWPQDRCLLPKGYTIYRKALDATAWGQGVSLPPSAQTYVDTNVVVGAAYEYQIVK